MEPTVILGLVALAGGLWYFSSRAPKGAAGSIPDIKGPGPGQQSGPNPQQVAQANIASAQAAVGQTLATAQAGVEVAQATTSQVAGTVGTIASAAGSLARSLGTLTGGWGGNSSSSADPSWVDPNADNTDLPDSSGDNSGLDLGVAAGSDFSSDAGVSGAAMDDGDGGGSYV